MEVYLVLYYQTSTLTNRNPQGIRKPYSSVSFCHRDSFISPYSSHLRWYSSSTSLPPSTGSPFNPLPVVLRFNSSMDNIKFRNNQAVLYLPSNFKIDNIDDYKKYDSLKLAFGEDGFEEFG